MPKWIFLIPFPPPRICQGGHYAKPSPEVRINPPPPPAFRAAPSGSGCERRCGRSRFPPGGPRMWKRRPLYFRLPALLFLSRRSHRRRRRLGFRSRRRGTCYIHPEPGALSEDQATPRGGNIRPLAACFLRQSTPASCSPTSRRSRIRGSPGRADHRGGAEHS